MTFIEVSKVQPIICGIYQLGKYNNSFIETQIMTKVQKTYVAVITDQNSNIMNLS